MSERELTGLIRVGYYGTDWKPQKGFSDPIWIGPKWLGDVIVGHLAKHYCQRKPGTLSEENAVRYQWFESVLVSEAWEPHYRREIAEAISLICRRQTPPMVGHYFHGIDDFSSDYAIDPDPPSTDHLEIISYMRSNELYQRAHEAEHLEESLKGKPPISHYVEDAELTVDLFDSMANPRRPQFAAELYQLATCRGNKTLATLLFASAIEDAKPRGGDVVANLALMQACVDKLGVEIENEDGWNQVVSPIFDLFRDRLAKVEPYTRPLSSAHQISRPLYSESIDMDRNLCAQRPLTDRESWTITVTQIISPDGMTMEQLESEGISNHYFKTHAKKVIDRRPDCGVALPRVGQRSLKFPLWFISEVFDEIQKLPATKKHEDILWHVKEFFPQLKDAMKPER